MCSCLSSNPTPPSVNPPGPSPAPTPAPAPPTPVPCPPPPPPSVAIEPQPCRFVPKGKTRKFKALGSPAGGTYSWTATGHISIVSGAATDTVEIKGDTVSGSLEDSTLKVT